MTPFEELEQGPQILVWNDAAEIGSRIKINAKFALDFFTRLGIPTEILTVWVNDLFSRSPLMRSYHYVRAYDAAKSTNERLKLREVINT